MSKERDLLKKCLGTFQTINVWDDCLIKEIIELLAQPEQEPSSDDFMYNKLKESYDELVELSFKDFQRGYGAALTHAVYVKEPARKPLSDEHLISAAPELLEALENWINAFDDPSEWMKCRDDAKKAIEKAHGIGVGDE
jgi:hypothetical protein